MFLFANFVEKVIFGFGEAKNIFLLEVEFSVNFSAGLTYWILRIFLWEKLSERCLGAKLIEELRDDWGVKLIKVLVLLGNKFKFVMILCLLW